MADIDKPVGTYQCVACGRLYDGSELLYKGPQFACSYASCGADVKRLSKLPRANYEISFKKD